ncbi:MAG: ABC transporter ATP-binding protein [Microbacteriaceae bacterium]|nr:ABC transporter ATP-binding protein [Microbacteriaceae bacterium]
MRGVSLELAEGEIIALLGPSGSGKSTLLRAIAGLERLAGGEIRMRGRRVDDVPTHLRGTGMVFQDGQLFPHRSVARNIGYGLERRGADRARWRERVDEMLRLVGLEGYGGRAVTELSGGQQQRVALARALAPEPQLLLLDEPLSALDRALRERLAGELREILRATATSAIHVTHDQEEAFTVADRIAVLDEGRLEQLGTAGELLSAPASPAVADLLGARARIEATVVARDAAGGTVEIARQRTPVAGLRAEVGETVRLRLR